MKTLQTIATILIISLTNFALADENELTLKIIEIQSPTCNGTQDGKAVVQAEGGVAPYSYNWNTFPAQYSSTATNLAKGTYFVQVKDAEGEVYFTAIHVNDPTDFIFNEFEESNDNEVDLTTTISGDNAPYLFKLNGESADAEKLHELPVGIHKLIITDVNNCEMVQYIQVFELEWADAETGERSKGYRINSSKEHLISISDETDSSNTNPGISVEKK